MTTKRHATETVFYDGAAGKIEVLCDLPDDVIQGIALIAHPQPLMGGNANHKIPHLLARQFQQMDFLVYRPNFRGVGLSEGIYDHGQGESDDLKKIAVSIHHEHPDQPLLLVGFSFGAFVQAKVAEALEQMNIPVKGLILIGTPYSTVESQRNYDTPPVTKDALIIHGEMDEIAPLDNLLNWLRPQSIPLTLIPGANHFFAGKLKELQSTIRKHSIFLLST